ncbi:MAG: DUF4105 domain-containing protein, partial [Gemmatimonadales bacterium]
GVRQSRCGAVKAAVLLSLLFTLIAAPAQGLPPHPGGVRAGESGAELTVYLMTMGPGKHVWERFGHNAIWIHDPIHGTDQTYNYGLFDFHQQNFLLRFVQGRMWYWMQGYPAQSYVESYRRANRSVWVQELEIPSAGRSELQRFLEWNELPENRFYHYDYYRDNCSTRVRDALDRALGGVIRAATAAAPSGKTYRFHTQRLTANDPPIYTGLLLALGQPVDRPISQWEEMFLPLAMREHVRSIRVTGPDGRSVPLVRSERTLFQSTEPEPSATPPSWTPWYLLAGLAIGGAAMALARRARTSGLARAGFLAVTWSWFLLTGLGGLVLAGLWGLTDHAAAYRNENVLQFDLLALPLIWLVTRLAFGSRRFAHATLVLTLAVAAISLLGLLLKSLPSFYQVNQSLIALALPAHAGIAAAAWSLAHKRKLIPSTAASTSSVGAT